MKKSIFTAEDAEVKQGEGVNDLFLLLTGHTAFLCILCDLCGEGFLKERLHDKKMGGFVSKELQDWIPAFAGMTVVRRSRL